MIELRERVAELEAQLEHRATPSRSEQLRQSEERARSVLETAPNIVVTATVDGVIQFANRGLGDTDAHSLIGRSVFDFVDESQVEKVRGYMARVVETGKTASYDLPDGDPPHRRFFMVRVGPVKHGDQVTGLTFVSTDITDRQRAEEKLRASLAEKDLLLREVHHRVKNNLQVITSLIHLQRRYAKTDRDQATFDEMYNRVAAMALVHEELHLASGEGRVDFKRYTKRLVSSLMLIHAEAGVSHRFVLEADRVSLDLDTAVTLGLLLNEAISNAFKHAFPPGKAGEILVSMRRADDGGLSLMVKDDGVGLPEGFAPKKTGRLGLQLMQALVRQLEAELLISGKGGTELRVQLPADSCEVIS